MAYLSYARENCAMTRRIWLGGLGIDIATFRLGLGWASVRNFFWYTTRNLPQNHTRKSASLNFPSHVFASSQGLLLRARLLIIHRVRENTIPAARPLEALLEELTLVSRLYVSLGKSGDNVQSGLWLGAGCRPAVFPPHFQLHPGPGLSRGLPTLRRGAVFLRACNPPHPRKSCARCRGNSIIIVCRTLILPFCVSWKGADQPAISLTSREWPQGQFYLEYRISSRAETVIVAVLVVVVMVVTRQHQPELTLGHVTHDVSVVFCLRHCVFSPPAVCPCDGSFPTRIPPPRDARESERETIDQTVTLVSYRVRNPLARVIGGVRPSTRDLPRSSIECRRPSWRGRPAASELTRQ